MIVDGRGARALFDWIRNVNQWIATARPCLIRNGSIDVIRKSN